MHICAQLPKPLPTIHESLKAFIATTDLGMVVPCGCIDAKPHGARTRDRFESRCKRTEAEAVIELCEGGLALHIVVHLRDTAEDTLRCHVVRDEVE